MVQKDMTGRIRDVKITDAKAIADIYNYYIAHTTVTYETELVPTKEMAHRIQEISSHHPYFVYEEDGNVIAYCYAHPWRTRAAYLHTLETTIYLDHSVKHHGIGTLMVNHLIELCKAQGYHALIACATDENQESKVFHEHLGFKQVAHYEQVGWKFDRWLGINSFELIL